MGIGNLVNATLFRAIGAVVALFVARFLYRGYVARSRVRAMKAQGIPILPHSLLFGHLQILGDWRAENPADANFYTFHTWLIRNCRRYYPDRDFPPPVVYLDVWPVEGGLALVFDPVAATQFTQTPSLPKLALATDFLDPLTSGLDIVTNEGAEWKKWRSRFNPGFSQRNLMAMLPELIEEVSIFVSQLEDLAGKGKERGSEWSPVFKLEEKTTNLTFDIICRAALGMRLNEQLQTKSSPLKFALLDQIRLMNMASNAARTLPIGRMPWHDAAVRRNNQTMRNLLIPTIERKLQEDADASSSSTSEVKTIVDLAIKYIDQDTPNASSSSRSQPDAEFVDRLVSNLKAFLFAGHDTTASTICFMIKLLADHPSSLAQLRAEHDAVLGSDPSAATTILTQSPRLLYALPYTLGVIKETLRLHPLAATMRNAPEGFCLSGPSEPGVQFPVSGWGVWLSAPGVARHPDYWPRPDEFLPERWTVPEGHPLHPVNNAAWAPFSIGPRNCIGMELALIELRIVSVVVARRFDFEEGWDEWDMQRPSKTTPNDHINGERLYAAGDGIVHPKEGMPVRVRLRTQTAAV